MGEIRHILFKLDYGWLPNQNQNQMFAPAPYLLVVLQPIDSVRSSSIRLGQYHCVTVCQDIRNTEGMKFNGVKKRSSLNCIFVYVYFCIIFFMFMYFGRVFKQDINSPKQGICISIAVETE